MINCVVKILFKSAAKYDSKRKRKGIMTTLEYKKKISGTVMDSTRLDVKFLADERELYDELQTCTDEDELLILMSNIQAHFSEELQKQQEQICERHKQLIKEKEQEKEGVKVDKSSFFKASQNIPSMMKAGITSTSGKYQVRSDSKSQDRPSVDDKDHFENKHKLDASMPLFTPRTKYGTYRLG
ncbi:hypothetical protein RFI_31835 [Reticulomyxa filosa]|uniref:Uncharacterized protein n=1 Tax=Reticulomyxa filosa TaxID=46433 RepID=X6LWP7_RETFI|nr:hypothetical protein RFI_31835 [Reticulomyxa filosa]|eukprot:ETO05562.1 hypothetical protein RFI_31835 [Reticulomyxa filosa]